jgi:hypothetical protein
LQKNKKNKPIKFYKMEKTIKITIDTATRWYNGENAELKELALQAFPELGHKAIEKGTLVWVKETENQSWRVGYYSHLDISRKSHQCFRYRGESSAFGWKICTAKNPFLEDEKSYQLLKKILEDLKYLRAKSAEALKNTDNFDASPLIRSVSQIEIEIEKFIES